MIKTKMRGLKKLKPLTTGMNKKINKRKNWIPKCVYKDGMDNEGKFIYV